MNVEDRKMLTELLAQPHENEEGKERFNARAFQEMLSRGRPLTDKQRAWMRDVYEKIVGTPVYENLVSSGKAPRGREVVTPAVLLNLPKYPPGRNPRKEDKR